MQRGRKRKAGATRHPSGQIKRDPINLIPAATIRRMITVAQARAADPFLATRLGVMLLHKEITETQAAAGSEFAKLVGRYERLTGLPPRSAKSPNYERGFGESAGTDDPDADPEQVAKARRRYADATAILRAADPHGAIARLVTRVCIDDRAPDWCERGELVAGLNLLALHFRMAREGR